MNAELSQRLGRIWSDIPDTTKKITFAELYNYSNEISKIESFEDLPEKLKELVLETEKKLKIKVQ